MAIDGGLRSLFHDRLKEGFHWQAIETGGTGRGIPDSNYRSEYAEGWTEFKQTETQTCSLRPEQVSWIHRRIRLGGLVYVITRRNHNGGPRKGPPVDELWIHFGVWVRELKMDGLLAAEPMYVGHGGPSNWDWDEVRRILNNARRNR